MPDTRRPAAPAPSIASTITSTLLKATIGVTLGAALLIPPLCHH